ncbi:tyrosine-type recombinase/integrase [Fictibacillus sp. KU28468]|uniref:tyrosine-type recombinase/integrase n=1 Tax=Fictibacillus sp. KU28468 TaxID=2991053 RepID=UPI00223DF9B4|nr:tyrosine-type recombinase/integrase [Fictibacillus sp. KU28468]UZJ79568.1 tyrosine-type recombinase/integrase [Fictibacillus sp. KU28468]
MASSQKYWQSTNEAILLQTKKVLNEYLLSLKLANKAEATITKYCWVLERFLMECRTPLADLTSDDVLQWFNDYSPGKKSKTLDLFHSCFTSFFNFCIEEDHMENQVMKKRWRPKIPQALPKYLSQEEYARVKLAAEDLSLRNRAIVLFFLSSGCRKTEVSNLNIQDVDVNKRTAEVKGKGGKIRKVHFSEECSMVLNEYLKSRSFQETDALFVTPKGLRLQSKGIYEMISRFGKKIELSLHPHCFRHTFATNMMARGAEIEFIADEMGHANINTTRVYARVPTEDMMIAYQNKMG